MPLSQNGPNTYRPSLSNTKRNVFNQITLMWPTYLPQFRIIYSSPTKACTLTFSAKSGAQTEESSPGSSPPIRCGGVRSSRIRPWIYMTTSHNLGQGVLSALQFRYEYDSHVPHVTNEWIVFQMISPCWDGLSSN